MTTRRQLRLARAIRNLSARDFNDLLICIAPLRSFSINGRYELSKNILAYSEKILVENDEKIYP